MARRPCNAWSSWASSNREQGRADIGDQRHLPARVANSRSSIGSRLLDTAELANSAVGIVAVELPLGFEWVSRVVDHDCAVPPPPAFVHAGLQVHPQLQAGQRLTAQQVEGISLPASGWHLRWMR